jgi:hypothetical protein
MLENIFQLIFHNTTKLKNLFTFHKFIFKKHHFAKKIIFF